MKCWKWQQGYNQGAQQILWKDWTKEMIKNIYASKYWSLLKRENKNFDEKSDLNGYGRKQWRSKERKHRQVRIAFKCEQQKRNQNLKRNDLKWTCLPNKKIDYGAGLVVRRRIMKGTGRNRWWKRRRKVSNGHVPGRVAHRPPANGIDLPKERRDRT